MKNTGLYVGVGAAIVGIVALCASISALITQFAWNLVMPSVFGLPEIGFWQALALMILISIIGGSIRARVRKS